MSGRKQPPGMVINRNAMPNSFVFMKEDNLEEGAGQKLILHTLNDPQFPNFLSPFRHGKGVLSFTFDLATSKKENTSHPQTSKRQLAQPYMLNHSATRSLLVDAAFPTSMKQMLVSFPRRTVNIHSRNLASGSTMRREISSERNSSKNIQQWPTGCVIKPNV